MQKNWISILCLDRLFPVLYFFLIMEVLCAVYKKDLDFVILIRLAKKRFLFFCFKTIVLLVSIDEKQIENSLLCFD